MDNFEYAKIFWEMGDLLELKDENPFKARAYRRAAQNIEAFPENIEEVYAEGGIKALQTIPGIGLHIAEKIEDQIKTGKISAYKKLLKEFPKSFLDIASIQSMGPKTANLLYRKLGIDSLKKLEKAAKDEKLRNLPGFGAKKEQNILRGLQIKKESRGRYLLDEATAYAELIVEELEKLKEVKNILPCGSLRRGQETIGDIDILVISPTPKKIMETFTKLPVVRDVLARGETKSSVILKNNMQADLRVVEAKSFGAAAHYFTGCKAHNIHLRQLAQKNGWKVSEYGIFKGKKQINGKSEEGMFTKFGFQYIPPELREMRGEFEAAAKKIIPKLVELKDIKGDLHIHTKATDGSNSIEEMAMAAKALGYEYIAITDHTQSTRIAGGLNEKEMLAHLKKIKAANKKVKGIEILAGSEVDILPNGDLDYSDTTLKEMDIVLAAIHSRFKMPKKEMTDRIIKAIQNKYVNIFVHPTGRLINERDPYELDMEKVLQAAKKFNVVMEINAHPKRLDLADIYCMRAKELGVKLAICTDAHSTDQLELMKFGVITARRGWLEKKNTINTLPLAKLKKLLYAR
ncbi:MAG: DNA polymerase/3'-5' exonuclease PolX [Candidatus Margulisiibacteriota bacterium]|nr:DNA polymerase/3'-5' exonuclease PolX [Candidatus Margulisiibacteriota bacterium]